MIKRYRKPFRRLNKPWRETVTEFLSSGPTQAYVDLCNDILTPSIPAAGWYCVGFVSACAWRQAAEPNRDLIERASKCTGFEEAYDVFQRWHRKLMDAIEERSRVRGS